MLQLSIQVAFPLYSFPFQLLPHFSNPLERALWKYVHFLHSFFPPSAFYYFLNFHQTIFWTYPSTGIFFCQGCQWLPQCQYNGSSWSAELGAVGILSLTTESQEAGYHILLGCSYSLTIYTQFLSLVPPFHSSFQILAITPGLCPWPSSLLYPKTISSSPMALNTIDLTCSLNSRITF